MKPLSSQNMQAALRATLDYLTQQNDAPVDLICQVYNSIQPLKWEESPQEHFTLWTQCGGEAKLESITDAQHMFCTGFEFALEKFEFERSKKALVLSGSYRLPLSLQYFVKLRGIGDDYEIPAEIVGPIQDYLEVLLAISNNERRRQVFLAGGLDVSDIPTEDVSYGRKVDMEQKMKSQRSALPMVTI